MRPVSFNLTNIFPSCTDFSGNFYKSRPIMTRFRTFLLLPVQTKTNEEIFLYLNWTEAIKIEWKLWKWHRYFETIYSLKHMLTELHSNNKACCYLIVRPAICHCQTQSQMPKVVQHSITLHLHLLGTELCLCRPLRSGKTFALRSVLAMDHVLLEITFSRLYFRFSCVTLPKKGHSCITLRPLSDPLVVAGFTITYAISAYHH
jgi:hypothetical protein